jgi:hypothetical protein
MDVPGRPRRDEAVLARPMRQSQMPHKPASTPVVGAPETLATSLKSCQLDKIAIVGVTAARYVLAEIGTEVSASLATLTPDAELNGQW